MKSRSFWAEQRGAAFLEYAVVFGLLAAGLVVSVAAVGSWIQREWAGQQGLYATYYSDGAPGTGSGGGTGTGTGSGSGSGSGSGAGSGSGGSGGDGGGGNGGNGNGKGGKK